MKTINKQIFLILGILFTILIIVSCGYANNTNESSDLELDKEVLKKYSNGATLRADYAMALKVAMDEFSKIDLSQPLENYLVSVFEIKECYFVQMRYATRNTLAGITPRYCVNKKNFALEEIPEIVIPIN